MKAGDTSPNFVRFLTYVRPYVWFIALGALGGVIKFTVPLKGKLLTTVLNYTSG